MNVLLHVKINGSHYDVGHYIGSRLKERIVKRLEKNRMLAGTTYETMVSSIEPYLTPSQHYFPDVIDEIKGIADGAQVDFHDLFLGNCMELFNADKETLAGDHCTIVAVPIHGTYVLGHNEDAVGYTPNDLYVLDAVVGTKPVFGISYIDGIIGSSVGVNGYGLVQAINSLPCDDKPFGVPRNIIARAIFTCHSLEEAEHLLQRVPRASGYNHVLMQNNEVWNIESTAEMYKISKFTMEQFAHTNHFLTDIGNTITESAEINIDESKARLEKVMKVIQKSNSIHDIQSILSDRSDPEIAKTRTIGSCVLDWANRTAYLCSGIPVVDAYYSAPLDWRNHD